MVPKLFVSVQQTPILTKKVGSPFSSIFCRYKNVIKLKRKIGGEGGGVERQPIKYEQTQAGVLAFYNC